MDLIDQGAEEGRYLSKVESIEYWDEQPPAEKIHSVTEYLHDVRCSNKQEYTKVISLLDSRLISFPKQDYRQMSPSDYGSPPSPSMPQLIVCI
jgi:hypothetical protein